MAAPTIRPLTLNDPKGTIFASATHKAVVVFRLWKTYSESGYPPIVEVECIQGGAFGYKEGLTYRIGPAVLDEMHVLAPAQEPPATSK